MKLAFIDCSIAGVSGDMLTAGLVDAGASPERIRRAMVAAGGCIGEVKVKITRTAVNEIKATRVIVETEDEGGRTYKEIIKRLGKVPMPDRVRTSAYAALKRLADAESRVHGKSHDKLYLHEVGAADAVADIVGACTAAEDLGILNGRILASEIAVGKGLTKFAHGNLPLPPPAVLEILKGVPAGRTVRRIADRREAIRAGLRLAAAGDVVLIAGKGHEDYQVVGEARSHFDDREEIETYIRETS